ncbi:hypothetical protein Daus18300_011586 [Diaporthe australafricana]|uniref:Uncharacterized protein n=1 Tax=Diaporthe australafricana TaxID=127596 RepID=A0ABR3W693_9PEZI
MIDPRTSGLSFFVKAINGANVETKSSNSVDASTLSLPGGRPIINIRAVPQVEFTTYTADMLVPYSDVVIYVTYSELNGTCDFQNAPAWPLKYNTGKYYCGVYKAEGTNMYRFSGHFDNTSGVLTWAWTLVGSVSVDQTGFTYTWVLPVGLSTMDTTSFVIETRGYELAADVFMPCPTSWGEGTGGSFCA